MKKNTIWGILGLAMAAFAALSLVPVKVQLLSAGGLVLFALGAIGLFLIWVAIFCRDGDKKEETAAPAEKPAEKPVEKSSTIIDDYERFLKKVDLRKNPPD